MLTFIKNKTVETKKNDTKCLKSTVFEAERSVFRREADVSEEHIVFSFRNEE
jgi:hypothetical protein